MIDFIKQILFQSIQLHLVNKENSLKTPSVQASCFWGQYVLSVNS